MGLSKYRQTQDNPVTFFGLRLSNGDAKVLLQKTANGNLYPLPEYRDFVSHSIGFEWGYGGSGPAQLAFALLYNVTENQKLSLKYYQRYKFDFVAQQSMDEGWRTTDTEITNWLEGEIADDNNREKKSRETAPQRK